MSEERAEQIIVVSLFVFMASEVGAHLYSKGKGEKEKKSLTKRVVGGFLVFLFSSLIAVAAPEVGAFLAIALASRAFFEQGLPALNKGSKPVKPEPPVRENLPGSGLGPEFPVQPLQESSPIAL